MNFFYDKNFYNWVRRSILVCLALICLLFLIFPKFSFSAPGINKQLPYQGFLKDSAGAVVTDGSYDMVFKIYSVATGGSALWTGNHTSANSNAVAVSDGTFAILLGSGIGNAISLDFNDDSYYLGLTVESDSEMTPRKRIGASGYAFNADTVDGSHAADFLSLTNWFATTTDTLSEGTINKYYSTQLFSTDLAGTTTDALSEGSANFYATQARWDSFWNASTTLESVTSLPNLATLFGLTDLIVTNSTTTNATSTNFYSSSFITTNATTTNLAVSGSSQLGNIISGSWLGFAIGETYGGTGQATYTTGDILYADGSNSLAKLGIGTAGQVLKVSGSIPSWAADLQGSGGGSGLWATTTNDMIVYPLDITDIVVVGSNATTTTGYILEIIGNSLFDGVTADSSIITNATTTNATTTNLYISGGLTTAGNVSLTNATSTSLYSTTIGTNSEYFTDLTGTGLTNAGGVLTLNATGDWTGTLDGQEGSYYLDADNLTNFGNQFYTFFNATNTDALSEGSTNKYYSTQLFATDLAGTTTDALSEGSANFYSTQVRWDSFWNASTTLASVTSIPNLSITESQVSDLTHWATTSTDYWETQQTARTADDLSDNSTTDLSEGSNLYWTNNRFDTRLSATTTLPNLTTLFGLTDLFSTNATTTNATTTNLAVSGSSQLGNIISGSWLGSAIGEIYGGTNQTTYTTGDILYADGSNSLAKLGVGTSGQVLKINGGVPYWDSDLQGGGGGNGAWATTTDDLVVYPMDTSDVVVVGSNATTTTGYIFEVIGNSLFDDIVASSTMITALTATNATTTNATSTNIVISGTASTSALIVSNTLTMNGTATSTFANGIDLSGGCFSVNGTCITGGVGASTLSGLSDVNTSGVSYGNLIFYNGASWEDVATSSLAINSDNIVGGSTNLFSQFTTFGSDVYYAAGNVGIGTTSPYTALSVVGEIVGSYFTATSTTATSTFAWGVEASSLNITSSTATSTFANGIDLSGGCFSVNGACLTSGGSSLQEVYNFIDTTMDTAIDGDVTDYWDEAAENGNVHPNITPSSTANEVLVMMSFDFASGGNSDTTFVARVEREIGSNPTCGSSTTVNGKLSGFVTDTSGYGSASSVFMDTPASVGNVRYTLCSDATSVLGSTPTIQQIQFSLVEINDASDLAEVYPTMDTTLNMAEIVGVDQDFGVGVARTEGAYNSNMLGVISTKPAMVIGGTGGEGLNGAPIALSGRAPVKVSLENGSISIGDRITSSSEAGVGMRASQSGYVIGIALENYDGESEGQNDGTVLMFVSPSWSPGEEIQLSDFKVRLTDLELNQENILLRIEELSRNLDIANLQSSGFDTAGISLVNPILSGTVMVDGIAVFNKDTAGVARIKAGSSFVDVVFENEYSYLPIVNVTPMSDVNFDRYFVSKASTKGFAINVSPVYTQQDVEFGWHAVAVKNPKIFSSDGGIEDYALEAMNWGDYEDYYERYNANDAKTDANNANEKKIEDEKVENEGIPNPTDGREEETKDPPIEEQEEPSEQLEEENPELEEELLVEDEQDPNPSDGQEKNIEDFVEKDEEVDNEEEEENEEIVLDEIENDFEGEAPNPTDGQVEIINEVEEN